MVFFSLLCFFGALYGLLSVLKEQTIYSVSVPVSLLSFLFCRKALNFTARSTIRMLSEVFPGLGKYSLTSLCNMCVVLVGHSQQNLFYLYRNGASLSSVSQCLIRHFQMRKRMTFWLLGQCKLSSGVWVCSGAGRDSCLQSPVTWNSFAFRGHC